MKVSISKVRLFKSCRRAYELRYVEGLEPVTSSDALQLGRSYHEKIEELYKTGAIDILDLSQASAMATAYQNHIYPYLSVKAVEEWFEYKLNDAHSIIGRVDGVTQDGKLVEHKTTSANLMDYECDLEWDEQILCYMLAYGVNDMVYTLIKKPTIRRRQGETEFGFFTRMVDWYDENPQLKIRTLHVYRSDEELQQFKEDMIKMCNEMEFAEDVGHFYKNPAYCRKWGTLCEYAQICKHYDPNETYVNFRKGK